MKKMLLIGNGVSRLQPEVQSYINDWIKNRTGEIWIFNYAYKEFGQVATRWGGHIELLEEVSKYKKNKKAKFEIYTNTQTKIKHTEYTHDYLLDSGSTAVRQALIEGFDCYLVGFDLGGADVCCAEHYKINKTMWVKRMYQVWFSNQGRVHFIGVDHSNIFRSRRFGLYYEKYSKGINHIT